MFATKSENNVTESDIMAKLISNDLVETDLISLGSFTGGNSVNDMSGNITDYIVDLDNPATKQTIISGLSMDVFVYARDKYKNRAVLKHPQSPVIMSSETIVLTWEASLFIKNVDDTKFAEHRNLAVPKPRVNFGENMFDFSKHMDGPKLYLDGNVDISEFVVDSARLVITSSTRDDPVVKTMSNLAVTDFGNVSFVVDQTHDDPPNNIEFGKTYYVYSVLHDYGLNKDYVNLEKTVQTGTAPALQNVYVKIDEV
jgi:hypothetical protein